MRVVVFGKYLLSKSGGAELSMRKYLEERFYDQEIILIGFRPRTNKSYLVHYETVTISPWVNFFRFQVVEYFVNARLVLKKIIDLNPDYVIIYGTYIPLGRILTKKGVKVEVHLRSETDLGIFANYSSGVYHIIKNIYLCLQFVFIHSYTRYLKLTLRNVDKIVCNSKFMSLKLADIFGRNGEIRYPIVSLDKAFRPKSNPTYIVMVGTEEVKGFKMFCKIARALQDEKFIVYTQNSGIRNLPSNVEVKPWISQSYKIYEDAKLVLVPSIWLEAYGRVAREAKLYNRQVLVSNIGGLPEAVNYETNNIVANYKDEFSWLSKIKDII